MNIVFRCDAGPVRGSGHFMRCLALADALTKNGCAITFVCAVDSGPLLHRVRDRKFGLRILSRHSEPSATTEEIWSHERQSIDFTETRAAMVGQLCDWIIVDHYGLNSPWECHARSIGSRIMAIDDLANRPHDCDLLLDQNEYVDKDIRYADLIPATTTSLLGGRYALLREEFKLARAKIHPCREHVGNILILMGGSDYHGLTLRIVRALQPALAPTMTVNIVVGKQNPHREKIEEAIRNDHRFKTHFDPKTISDLMLDVDIAFGAGGTSTWELGCLGVPVLIASFADNQIKLARDAATLGLIKYIGHFDVIDEEVIRDNFISLSKNRGTRQDMHRKCIDLVDGLGTERAMRAIIC